MKKEPTRDELLKKLDLITWVGIGVQFAALLVYLIMGYRALYE